MYDGDKIITGSSYGNQTVFQIKDGKIIYIPDDKPYYGFKPETESPSGIYHTNIDDEQHFITKDENFYYDGHIGFMSIYSDTFWPLKTNNQIEWIPGVK